MLTELIQLTFDKIMQTKAYTVVVLGAHDKRFAIYTDPGVGKMLQMYLTGVEKSRPLTHDLMNNIFRGYGIKVKQVVITDVQDTIYLARLFLEQKVGNMTHIVEVDARPSDCITLALMNNVPVYCTREVLEKIIPATE